MGFSVGSIIGRLIFDIRDWKQKHKIVKSDIRMLGRSMVALGGAVTGFAALGVREFGKFDKSLRESLAVSDVTEEQFRQMSKMAEDASVRLNKAAVETAKGFYYLGSAGLSASEQMQSFNEVVGLARALTIDTAQAAEGLVDVMKAFDYTFDQSQRTADTLVKTIITSNQVFSDLDKALSYVSSTANMAGIELGEVAALLGVMANAGIKGSMSGVALRRAITNLMSPTSEMTRLTRELNLQMFESEENFDATGESIQATRNMLDEMGISMGEGAGKMKNFIDILGELEAKMKTLSPKRRGEVLEVLFGRRAIAGMIKGLDFGAVAMREYADELTNAAGTMDLVIKKQMMAFLNQLGRLWQWLKRVSRSIGEALVPNIKAMIDKLIPAVSNVETWIESNKALTASIVKWTTALGLLTMGLGTLLILAPGILAAFKIIAAGIALLAVVSKTMIPIAVIITTLYALRAISKDALGGVMEHFKTMFEYVGDNWKSWLEYMKDNFEGWSLWVVTKIINVGEIISQTWRKMSKLHKAALDDDVEAVKKALQDLKSFEYDLTSMEQVLWGMGPAWETAKYTASKIPELIGEMGEHLEASWNVVKKQFSEDIDAMIKMLKGKFPILEKLLREWQKMWNAMGGIGAPPLGAPSVGDKDRQLGGAEELSSAFMQIWKRALQSVAEDFEALSYHVENGLNGIVDQWANAFDYMMQKGSSFKEFMNRIFMAVYSEFTRLLGRQMAESLFYGLTGKEAGAGGQAAFNIVKEALSWVKGKPGGLFGGPAASPDIPMGHSPYFLEKPVGSVGKVAVVVNNQGPPIDLNIDRSYMDGDTMVMEATMRLAETDPTFRKVFVNEEVK